VNVHLDTHVVLWLYAGAVERLTEPARALLRAHRPVVSPAVHLELALLHEIGRVTVPAADVLNDLRARADLGVAESAFGLVTARAATLTWTRDPFDRIIAAHALCDDAPLLTADAQLLRQCPVAVWDRAP
jgi:PIN domain nuclease of toxin-antitoxin system